MLRINNKRELIKGEFAKEIRRQAALACKKSGASTDTVRSNHSLKAKKSIKIVWE
ncbi:MAG: hypothetical protein Q4D56_07430 [Bacteroides sp.]|nr:hypothetical protein [Bacteroides sp.]